MSPPRQSDVTANLELPLTVGIAFVPSEYGNAALTEAERVQLLNKVKAHFASREYIREIPVIPEAHGARDAASTSPCASREPTAAPTTAAGPAAFPPSLRRS